MRSHAGHRGYLRAEVLGPVNSAAAQAAAPLGAGFAYPVTLDKVGKWAASLSNRGFQLAPASAMAIRR